MILKVDNSDGSQSVLGEPKTRIEAMKMLKKYFNDKKIHSPYMRMSVFNDEKRIWIDYGSWSNFAHIVDMTDEQMKEWIDG